METERIASKRIDTALLGIEEMQSLIGVSEDLTETILHRLIATPPTRLFFPLYTLLLLERYDSALPLVENVMSLDFDLSFLNTLQSSRFYLHRMAVPAIIRNHTFPEKKIILRIGLRDEICEVVRGAVASILISCPFDAEELLEIAIELYRSRYTMVKVLCVDILTLIGESSFLLTDLIKNTNWRVRLKVASRVGSFPVLDQQQIIEELINDSVDEVRMELAKHVSTPEIQLLEDPNEHVRGNYLEKMLDKITDETTLQRILEDESWGVRKKLLGLKGERFRRVTIPLIRNRTDGISWREKIEVLQLVEMNVEDELTAKMLMGFLLKHMRDKVSEVRHQAERILVMIVQKYEWVQEYFYELEPLVMSSNYLHRVNVVPVVVEYDLKFRSDLGRRLRDDRVLNVRERFIDYCRGRGAALEYLGEYEEGENSLSDSPVYYNRIGDGNSM